MRKKKSIYEQPLSQQKNCKTKVWGAFPFFYVKLLRNQWPI